MNLQELAQDLQRDNPSAAVFVDGATVWLRADGSETDHGIYSTLLDGKILCCVDGGVTVLHRCRECKVANAPGNGHLAGCAIGAERGEKMALR